MRVHLLAAIIGLVPLGALSQGTPPPAPAPDGGMPQYEERAAEPGLPPAPEPKLQRMKSMMKKEISKAVDQCDPSLQQWRPLTNQQKFQLFLKHTTSPRTFAGAAVDAASDKLQNDNYEYARGVAGYGQHYVVELAKGESDAFFQTFLIPVVLRQDPRYFRNPNLPFFKRALYSMTRVVVTRSDSGHQTFNASYVLGGAASQALSDLYVPGHAQGLHPIAHRLTFNLARDAGFNLLHEFWPDLRRKFLHR